ncbi:MAG: ABC transporter substrate-binding protein [Candidatus Eremiobacteraeota bacterium]|nr:ABC transporter substrate-binding protein [Candidatus Eremiobacteraeota bacterium]
MAATYVELANLLLFRFVGASMSFSLNSCRIALAALGVLALVPSFARVASAAPKGEPVVVGAILSMTGPYAPLGEPESRSLKIAEADINAHGGIGGRPLQITIEDDEGKADTAAQLATSLIGKHVAMIIGGSLTPTSAAIARVTNEAKVLQIFMTPTQQLWNTKAGILKYLFEATPRNELEAAKLLNYAKTTLKAKKIAVMHDDAPYGTQGALVVAAEAKNADVTIVDDEPFPINASDVTAQLGKVKASGADTVFIWTASPVAPLAVRQIRQLGMNINVVGSTGIVSDNFLRIAGKDGEGVLADMDLNVTHPNAPQRKFLTAYRAAYNTRPNNFASFAWDAAHLAALALTEAKGKYDGDSLAAALLRMKPYGGSTGTYKYTDTDHNGMRADDIHMAVDRHQVWFTL